MAALTKRAPGPAGTFIGGNFAAVQRDPLGTFLVEARRHGDVVRFRLGPFVTYLVTNPADVQRVLVDRAKSFTKRTLSYQRLKSLLGEGLVTSEGAQWLRQRRLAQPAFHRDSIASFAATMSRLGSAMVDAWAARTSAGQPLDVEAELSAVTMKIVCATLLGVEATADAGEVARALAEGSALMRERTSRLLELGWLPTDKNRRYDAAVKTLDRIVNGIIERRRREPAGSDLLAMFLAARDADTGLGMSDLELRDEVMTMFLAGHETTSTALTWALYLLAKNPIEERALREEVRAVLGDRPPALADLERMPRLRRVVEETLRMFPPVWGMARMTAVEEELGGYRIKRGEMVFLSPWATQRLEKWWPDPERFDSDRFLPEHTAARHRFAWFPFLGGPRICIGNTFAMMEAQLLLATMVQRYSLSLVEERPLEIDAFITMRPRGGLRMRAEKVA